MKKLNKIIALVCLSALLGFLNFMFSPVYVSQSGGSVSCGVDGTQSTTAIGSVSWTSGNIYKLCGAITTGFTIGADNVTVFWETAARVSVPFGQIINLNHKTNLTFDGGVACGPSTNCAAVEAANPTGYATGQAGIIEATANGSSLANRDVQTQAFYNAASTGTLEIKNLITRGLYRHSLLSDVTSSADTGNFMFQCPSTTGCASGTISLHDLDIHDVGIALSIQRTNATTINFYSSEIWNVNWAVEDSGNGTRTFNFFTNHVHDWTVWDTTADAYHHNTVHLYMNVSSDSIATNIYNNKIDGDAGSCCDTALLSFTEVAHPENFAEFNNHVEQNCNNNTAPAIDYGSISNNVGAVIENNTLIGCALTIGNTRAFDMSGTSVIVENNAVENFGQYVVVNSGATLSVFDYNTYGPIGISGNAAWQCMATPATTFAAWKATSCAADTNGQKISTFNINSAGVPRSGSALISAGVNLFSACHLKPNPGIGALCFDKNDVARSATLAWTVGAYEYQPVLAPIFPSPFSVTE